MNWDTASSSGWEPCRHGEVGQLVAHLRGRHRAHRMQRAVAVAMVLVLGLFTSYYNVLVIVHAADPGSGQFACNDIWLNCEKFLAGELDDELDETIHRHLKVCPACRKRVFLYSRARLQQQVSHLMDSGEIDANRSGTHLVQVRPPLSHLAHRHGR